MNVGSALAGSSSVAVLPCGAAMIDQKNCSGSPSASLEPVPSRSTVAPWPTVWSGPASATGREPDVETSTLSGSDESSPSFTISCTWYVPGWSTVKLGMATVGSSRLAVLPAGRDSNDHR